MAAARILQNALKSESLAVLGARAGALPPDATHSVSAHAQTPARRRWHTIELAQEPTEGFTAELCDDNLFTWHVYVEGPKDTRACAVLPRLRAPQRATRRRCALTRRHCAPIALCSL